MDKGAIVGESFVSTGMEVRTFNSIDGKLRKKMSCEGHSLDESFAGAGDVGMSFGKDDKEFFREEVGLKSDGIGFPTSSDFYVTDAGDISIVSDGDDAGAGADSFDSNEMGVEVVEDSSFKASASC